MGGSRRRPISRSWSWGHRCSAWSCVFESSRSQVDCFQGDVSRWSSAVQAVVYRENGLDVLLCKIMARPGDEEGVAARIVAKLWEERPMLKQHIDLGLIAPVTVNFWTWLTCKPMIARLSS